jgi:hypothetical protein
VANDASGNGNAGTLVNSPAWTGGKVGGGALSLNGSTSYVNLISLTSLGFSTNFTYMAWIKLTSNPGGAANIVGLANGGGGGNSWEILAVTPSPSQINYRFNNSSGSLNALGGTTLNNNQWYHLAVSVNGTSITIYLNGISDGSGVGYASFLQTPTAGSFGTFPGQAVQNFPGLIDDVRIYNRALSASEIQALYNAEK